MREQITIELPRIIGIIIREDLCDEIIVSQEHRDITIKIIDDNEFTDKHSLEQNYQKKKIRVRQ